MSHNTAEASRCEAKATAGLGTRAAQLSIQNTQKLYSRSSPSIIFEYSMCRINTRARAGVLFLSILNTQLRRAVGLPRGCSSLTGTTMVLLGDALGPALVQSETKPSRSETEADLNQINTRPKRHCSLAEARRIQSDREAICARSIPENTVMNPKQTSIENIPT